MNFRGAGALSSRAATYKRRSRQFTLRYCGFLPAHTLSRCLLQNYATKLGSVSQTPTTQQQTWVPPNAAFPNQQAHTNGIATHAPQGLPSGPQGLRSPNPDGATTNNAGAPASTNANSGSAGGPGGGSDAAGAGAGGATGTGTGLGEMAQTPAQQVLSSPADRFGLLGLLSVIKMQDPDLSMLAMGSDLQTLGLNLNAPE